MARPLRIQYPGAWYHITSRGNEQRDIFHDDADRGRFLDILGETAAIYGTEIHAYVLMTNHFHFVVHTPQANLSRFMQRFNTTYTANFNRRHRRSGHLFQGRFKGLLVDADNYLLELSRYVHLNPVRIQQYKRLNKTGKRKVLESHRWSSYRGYVHIDNRPEFLHCEKILAMVGTGDNFSSRKVYQRFVLKGLDKEYQFDLKEEVSAQTVLGTEDFQEWLRKRFLDEPAVIDKEIPTARTLSVRFGSPAALAVRLVPVLGVSADGLMQVRSKHRVERAIFLEFCRRYLPFGRSIGSLAAELGISVSAFSQNSKRLARRMETDTSFRIRFANAERQLDDSQ